MTIAEQATTQAHLVSRSHRWTACSYTVFALVALTAIYLASVGPGYTEAELAKAITWP
jgi:hypothetical protein